MHPHLLFLFFSLFILGAYGQDTLKTDTLKSVSQTKSDTIKKKKKRQKKIYPIDTSYHHSTKTAILLSTFFPGAGQMYNEIGYRKYRKKKSRAWWKIPLIYGGLGVCGYYFYYNYEGAKLLKEEYLVRDANPGLAYHHPQYAALSSLSQVQAEFDIWSRDRDLLIFTTLGVYALQIIEALVDAHFVTFDISENLSFHWSPMIIDRSTAGLNLTLQF